MAESSHSKRQSLRRAAVGLARGLGKLALAFAMIAGLAWLLLMLAGYFREKVPSDVAERAARSAAGFELAEVRWLERPRYESAVGTVRPVHEASLASKLLARVVEVNVKAGQTVSGGDVLVRLDDAELQARVAQAQASVAAADSAQQKAAADFARGQQLLANRAIAQAEYDGYAAALRTAEAELERAQQTVREAQVLLDYASIAAPMTGIVIDKRVDVGDTVTPGQVLVTLYDPTRMQLVATVRESLAERLTVGQAIRGRLESLDHECDATISEIVPQAEAASRSFTVKVTGPCPPGIYGGMFGRILIPLEDERLLVVPAAAIRRVGQLAMVDVALDGRLQRRAVQLGRRVDEDVEVLSGLAAGERVALAAESPATSASGATQR